MSLNFFVDFEFIIKSPLVYLSNPPIILSKVVFPLPEGPKILTNSFFLNSRFIPFNALCLKSPVEYIFFIFFNFSIDFREKSC